MATTDSIKEGKTFDSYDEVTELNSDDILLVKTNAGVKKTTYGKAVTTPVNEITTNLQDPTLLDAGGYIGRKIEGGGTIFFDYAIGYKYGSLSVAPITSNLHTYHVDLATGMVVCDDAGDTTKKDRFYVVDDKPLVNTLDGGCPQFGSTDLTTIYNVLVGTDTAFGTGKANTEKLLTAAQNGGGKEWSALAYKNIWHYIWLAQFNGRGGKMWLPSKDELNVLMNMQWINNDRCKGYNGESLRRIPVTLPPILWSSSEQSATVAYVAGIVNGRMDTRYKYDSNTRVCLVGTF